MHLLAAIAKLIVGLLVLQNVRQAFLLHRPVYKSALDAESIIGIVLSAICFMLFSSYGSSIYIDCFMIIGFVAILMSQKKNYFLHIFFAAIIVIGVISIIDVLMFLFRFHYIYNGYAYLILTLISSILYIAFSALTTLVYIKLLKQKSI